MKKQNLRARSAFTVTLKKITVTRYSCHSDLIQSGKGFGSDCCGFLAILQKSCHSEPKKCHSEGFFDVTVNGTLTKEICMSGQIKILFITIGRVSVLTGKTQRSVWRMINNKEFYSIKRNVQVGNRKTNVAFILVNAELFHLELKYCTEHNIKQIDHEEDIVTIGEKQHPCLFLKKYYKSEVHHV